ncbi:uncharacterized protein LOC108511705 [Phoenix dactylifera]|uniref:Uncharacterized protein LOC108511705 n=1 Tax=Phoenix dactylifera TaxID=42345 RepID=A0A8B8JAZ5_PHODC|nr:uncharacterized protein LOC108511705 [Phoenix dactylifera]
MPILSTTVHLQRCKTPGNAHINHHLAHPKSLNSNPLKKSISMKKPDHWPAPHGTKTSSAPGGQDFGKPERVDRLHSAIKNRSIKELFDLTGEECRDYFNLLLAAIDPSELSKKALGMFYAFLVANRIQFVIKPTKDEGVDFGMKWRLEWKENQLPLGLGCSLYTSHIYEGMVSIRKARNIIEPLLHMGPLGPMLEKIFLPMIDRIVPSGVLEGKRRVASVYCFLSLVFLVIFLVSLKNTFVLHEEK